MAKGGEVGQFCEGPHNEDCEYFSVGGEVPKFDDIPSEQEQVPSFDEIPQAASVPKFDEIPGEVPAFDDIPTESQPEKPTDYIEQAKTAAEGFAQGVAGDLAKLAEVKLGISTKEEIEQREKDYPVTHTASKIGGFVAGPSKLLKGATVLKNMLVAVSYAESNKISKALLDQPDGDVSDAVASSLVDGGVDGLIDGAMYSLTGGLFSAVKGSKILQDKRIVKAAEDALISLADKPINKIAKTAATVGLVKHVSEDSLKGALGGVAGYEVLKKQLEPIIEKVINKPLSKSNAYVGDVVLNQLIKTDYLGIPAAIRYAQKIARGESAVTHAVEGLFKAGEHEGHEWINRNTEKSEENIKKMVEDGGVDRELVVDQTNPIPGDFGFAKGGEVPSQPKQTFANAYPAHNMLLNAARGRVSGYLNSIRPLPNQGFVFDAPTPQKDKKRQYDRAVKIAANPLSVLKSMNKGTLVPDDVKHLNQMYPEVYGHIAKKLTARITDAQLKGERPTYKKRQAMSLFLGAELDSTFTPQAIATIQGMYQMNKGGAQQPQSARSKKSTTSLSKLAPSAMTDSQARTNREQNQKA